MKLIKLPLFNIFSCILIFSLASGKRSSTEQAFYITQNACDKISNEVTGGPILLTSAHIVVAGTTEKIEGRYGPTKQLYSARVKPHCIAKGNTKETEIVVRNLGETKCGPSEAEVNKSYLFFLRNTSDPKVFEALNLGAKPISGPMMWSPIFTMFCGITKQLMCETSRCLMACTSYTPPSPNGCIPVRGTVIDSYKLVAPTTTVEPPTSKKTSKPTTTKIELTTMRKPATTRLDLTTTRKPTTSTIEMTTTRKPTTSTIELTTTRKPTTSTIQLTTTRQPTTSTIQLTTTRKPKTTTIELTMTEKSTTSLTSRLAKATTTMTKKLMSTKFLTSSTTSFASSTQRLTRPTVEDSTTSRKSDNSPANGRRNYMYVKSDEPVRNAPKPAAPSSSQKENAASTIYLNWTFFIVSCFIARSHVKMSM